jgi:hypothetical protein
MKKLVSIVVFCLTNFTTQAATSSVSSGESIQLAINQAQDGDVIEVAPGIYGESIDFQGKELTVRSVAGAGNTVINGGGTGTTVKIGGDSE